MDDIPVIVDNPYIKDLSNIPLYFEKSVWSLSRVQEKTTPYYRPMFLLSIALDYKAWGLNPLGYRITNLILHFIIVLFVYLIADMLLKDKTGALIASAFFALHPANTEVVAWISGRTDAVAGIFLLPAFLLHYKKQYYFSIPLFACALFSKETSIVLPLLIGFYSIINGKKLFEILKEITPYLILIIIYLAIRSMVLGGVSGMVLTHEKSIFLVKVIFHYLRFIIFPLPIAFIPDDAASTTLFPDIIGAIIFASIIIFSLKMKRKAVLFLLIWIGVAIIPTFAVILNPLHSFTYRFLYIPLIGCAIIIGGLASHIFKNWDKSARYAATSIMFIALISYTAIIYIHGFNYRSNTALWENSLKYFPDSAFAHSYLAASLDDIEGQIHHYKIAINIDPSGSYSGNRYIGLGTAYAKLGNYAIAKEYIEKGIKNASTYAGMSVGCNSLGNIYYLEKNLSEAKRMYEKAIETDNLNAEAYYNLALALKSMGMTEEASQYMKQYETLASEQKLK
ncbi:MAG: glycosyltransferase family 39 protein [Deltaproteobacteria bacterium]|nr:glycosyltransferase family 39 protein [Deltaproteobacteria bacterium]